MVVGEYVLWQTRVEDRNLREGAGGAGGGCLDGEGEGAVFDEVGVVQGPVGGGGRGPLPQPALDRPALVAAQSEKAKSGAVQPSHCAGQGRVGWARSRDRPARKENGRVRAVQP